MHATATTPTRYHEGSHQARVRRYLSDHRRPVTLAEISQATGIPSPGSIASRIRDLRADGHLIERRPTDIRGVFTYEFWY